MLSVGSAELSDHQRVTLDVRASLLEIAENHAEHVVACILAGDVRGAARHCRVVVLLVDTIRRWRSQ